MYKSQVHIHPEPHFHWCLELAKDYFGDDYLTLRVFLVGNSVSWAHKNVAIKEGGGIDYIYGLKPRQH